MSFYVNMVTLFVDYITSERLKFEMLLNNRP
jgi:hypothetical protein